MTESPNPARSLDELTLGAGLLLEDLVDQKALAELSSSFRDLFGVPLRIFSQSGVLFADASYQPPVYDYLSQHHRSARAALQEVVSAVKRLDPGPGGHTAYTCFTGAVYEIMTITYDGRTLGRMVLGPFLPPSVKGVPPSLLAIDPGIDVAVVGDLLKKMPRARPETVQQIARHLRGTLDVILFSGHKTAVTNKMHLASVRESFRDLEQKNAALQEAFDRLRELDVLKSNFLATVSHELKTPLTSIIGYSEMLVEGIAGEMPDEQRGFVRTIHEKGQQLLDLITGLLDLSKLESGTLSMKKADVAVEKLVSDVVVTVTPTARKKSVVVSADVQPGLPMLWADSTRLRQVILNLVDNALKFTPDGGRVVITARSATTEIEPDSDMRGLVLLSRTQPAVELRVADTGIGIADADKEKVFDPFYQVDSSSTRQVGGTGLGLSIVRRLVTGHDGKVWVEDNRPRGAVFVVQLPVRRITLS